MPSVLLLPRSLIETILGFNDGRKKMKKLFLLISLLLAFGAQCAMAASWDCSRAKSYSEKLICSDPVLSKADEGLAELYAEAKKQTGNSKEFRKFVANNWKEREKCADRKCVYDWFEKSSLKYQRIAANNPLGIKAPAAGKTQPEQKPVNPLVECWENTILALDDGTTEIYTLGKVVARQCRPIMEKVMEQEDVIRRLPKPDKLRLLEASSERSIDDIMGRILAIRKIRKESASP